MKKLLSTCVVAVGLLMPLAFTPAVHAEPAREHHPEIHEALQALEKSKFHLEHARHDFGGHREAALHAVDEAIKQLREVLKYDR